MFVVIFEVNPKAEQWEAYLATPRLLAARAGTDRRVHRQRALFQVRRKGWLLSLSIWRDEKAVIRWRTHARHHEVEQKGRTEVFGDYHLRVGEIIADNRLPAGQALREQRFDETAAAAKLIALSEAAPERLPDKPDADTVAARLGSARYSPSRAVDWDVFESIVQPGKFILLRSSRDVARRKLDPRAVRIFAIAAFG